VSPERLEAETTPNKRLLSLLAEQAKGTLVASTNDKTGEQGKKAIDAFLEIIWYDYYSQD
jgi:hypothetical protein